MTQVTDPEYQFQCMVAAYLDYALPEPYIYSAFPAGGGGKFRGAMLQRMGLKRGWPDIQIIGPLVNSPMSAVSASRFIGLELKRKGGRASPEQKAQAENIRRAGGIVYFCDTIEKVETFLRIGEGIALKATAIQFYDAPLHARQPAPLIKFIDDLKDRPI